jgi:ketosteroid isomerase-like protein
MRQLPRRSTHLSTIQARAMTDEDLIALVQEYFAGVDSEDVDRVLSTLTEDCRFTVETHQVELIGHGEIKGMFERLWQNHSAVRHHAFTYVPSAARGQIAAQFQVRDRSEVHKSNCNFFRLRGGRFDAVAVYMTGENTLKKS